MNIETSITICVYPNPDYHFEVHAGDVVNIEYVEHVSKNRLESRSEVSFGSLEEMKAVAEAMLQVVANSSCPLYQ